MSSEKSKVFKDNKQNIIDDIEKENFIKDTRNYTRKMTIYKKISDLTINKRYLIIETKCKDFGESIILTIIYEGEFINIILSNKNNSIKKSFIKFLIGRYIIYKGQNGKKDFIIKITANASESDSEDNEN